jgi:hypothetical protein
MDDDPLPKEAQISYRGSLVAIPLYDNEGTPGTPEQRNNEYVTQWRTQRELRPKQSSVHRKKHHWINVMHRVCGPYVVVRSVGTNEKTSAYYILRCALCGHEVTRCRRNILRREVKACGNCQGTGVPTQVKGRFHART